MKPSDLVAMLAVALSAAGAAGQTYGVATWLWEVSNVLSPDTPTATVTLRVDMVPDTWDAGKSNGKIDGGPVQGFAAVAFDVPGDATASISSWKLNAAITFLLGDTTQRDAVGGLARIAVGQIPGFGPQDDSDPIWIMDFTVTTDDFSPRTLAYSTRTTWGAYIWTSGDPSGTLWETIDASIGVQVVPAPGWGLPGVLGLMLGCRRRR
jgi:hypothetical protein